MVGVADRIGTIRSSLYKLKEKISMTHQEATKIKKS